MIFKTLHKKLSTNTTKTVGELECSVRVSSSCCICDTRCVNYYIIPSFNVKLSVVSYSRDKIGNEIWPMAFLNSKNDNSSGTSQIWRTTTLMEYFKLDEWQLSSHTQNPRTTFLLSYLKLEEWQLTWHITNSKNDNSPLMLQTRVKNQNIFLLIWYMYNLNI